MISVKISGNDKDLHDVVTKNMIHGPCEILNPIFPCMIGGKRSECYPRQLVEGTITENDGYSLLLLIH